jgi:hypothetical protein
LFGLALFGLVLFVLILHKYYRLRYLYAL